MPFLRVRIPDDIEDEILARSQRLGYENVSQYVRFILRKEIGRLGLCPNCDRRHGARALTEEEMQARLHLTCSLDV